ncbi:hypothetical protein EKO27_g10316 [Xylaria grammica]|uniref:Phosphoglycerate mutase family protein n=1 Tax=Xylaria grammica TaxID=363999 RepID=A0A439CRS6_9PEZI|nr:hypothetical protein EKO27_g10316 [Xylaria grammica]
MQLSGAVLLTSLAATLAAAARPTVYLIRHGEKPADGGIGAERGGRAARRVPADRVRGRLRVQHRMLILKKKKKRNKKLTLRADGKRERPYLTVKPLADDLGLTVDTSCDRDDEKCVKDAVDDYDGDGNILICWEHSQLNNLSEELGAMDVDNYPDDSYDLIWTQPYDYNEITAVTSESCPGLDV